jgi:hypothetical protein
MASNILADNGVSSGSAGIKTTADSTGALALQTTTAGGTATTAVTINTSQNVGIGTASPTKKLELGALGAFRLQTGSVTMDCTPTAGGVDGFVWNVSAGYYSWNLGGAQKMILDASGNVGVGITNPSAYGKLAFSGNLGTTGSQFNMYPGADYEFVQRNSYKMNFYVNGASVLASLSITGVWTNASDARYKENIVDSQYGLATVMALQPRSYNLIDQTDKPQIGFIAQEVLEVVPEVVESVYNSVTEEDRYTLSYGNLTAVLVKAIQEQQAMIASQSELINNLTESFATLTARIEALEAK